MRVLAIIPARGGSKGIPGKNLKKVGGLSLVARAIRAARATPSVSRVAVSTDVQDIAREAASFGAEVVVRPDYLSVDSASSESAIEHAVADFARRGETFDAIVFIQPTSPFIRPEDIESAIGMLVRGEADSVFSACLSHCFIWRDEDAFSAVGVNHDKARRPRRQDRPAEYRETGAFYVFGADAFMKNRHRFFGRTRPCIVPPDSAIEIDEPGELAIARRLAPLLSPSIVPVFSPSAVVFDFDGVMTDDKVLVLEDGREAVTCSRGDGMGIAALKKVCHLLVLSTEKNPVVAARARKLGLPVIHGCDGKLAALTSWAADRQIPLSAVAYVGNDINDLECLEACGLGIAPSDAHPVVLSSADFILDSSGGRGAVREVCDMFCRQKDSDK